MRKIFVHLLAGVLLTTTSMAWCDSQTGTCKKISGDPVIRQTECAPDLQFFSFQAQVLEDDQPESFKGDESDTVLILNQNSNGHYLADGAVNDISLAFAIDTGATLVTLPQQVATDAGIECENEAVLETANGTAEACMGTIAELKFGDFSLAGVQCMIAPNLNQALLGNNVLKKFKISQNKGEMRISKQNNE